MIERRYLAGRKTKRKEHCNYEEFKRHSNEKVERGQRNLWF